jgi:ADP-ribosylglycohydrolase
VLPAGLFFNYDTEIAFRAGVDFAAITHGSPVSYLSAGVYAAVIAELINGENIDEAIEKAFQILKTYKNHQEVALVIDKVQNSLEDDSILPMDVIKYIGTEDNAAQVLGISLFCAALFEDSYENAIRLAANQDGLSDVCAAMTGGLLGAYHGAGFVPKRWVLKLSHLRLVEDIAISLVENSYFDENRGEGGGSGDSDEFEPEHESEKNSSLEEPHELQEELDKFEIDFDSFFDD